MQVQCSGWRSQKQSRSAPTRSIRGVLEQLSRLAALIRHGETEAALTQVGAADRNQKSVARNGVRSAYLSGGSIDRTAYGQPSHNNPPGIANRGAGRAVCALRAAHTPTSPYLGVRAGALRSNGGARAGCQYRCRVALVSIEVPDALLDALADRLALRLANQLAALTPSETSPWMTFEEAVEYTKVPAGTFRKLSAEGTFTAHGGKRKVYHRQELDAALSGSPCMRPAILRRAS